MKFKTKNGPLVLLLVWLGLVLVAHRGLAGEGSVARQLFATARHVSDLDEPEDSRAERLDRFARVIEDNARSAESRAVLLTLNHFEAASARYVLENRCSDGPRGEAECDHGRAVGPWQLHGSHDLALDLDAQARRAVGRWRHHKARCGGTIEGAFAGYARGEACTWSGAAERAAKFRTIVRRL